MADQSGNKVVEAAAIFVPYHQYKVFRFVTKLASVLVYNIRKARLNYMIFDMWHDGADFNKITFRNIFDNIRWVNQYVMERNCKIRCGSLPVVHYLVFKLPDRFVRCVFGNNRNIRLQRERGLFLSQMILISRNLYLIQRQCASYGGNKSGDGCDDHCSDLNSDANARTGRLALSHPTFRECCSAMPPVPELQPRPRVRAFIQATITLFISGWS